MKSTTDIDIDVANRDSVLNMFKHTPASLTKDKGFVKHNTGVYFHKMPTNPITGLATIDHKKAEEEGFFKLDILNVGVYNQVTSEQHLVELMLIEPPWHRLLEKEFTEQLIHISNHYDIIKQMKPETVEQLAAILAIIRPAKRYLLGENWDKVFEEVWEKPTDDTYYFKKSHAIAYAHLVIVHMNLL